MKKLIIGCFCCLLCVGATISANAQLPTGMLGQAVGKAAKKMAGQAADKVADEAAKRVERALGQDQPSTQSRQTDAEVNPEENTYRQGRVNVTEGGTYASVSEVMAAMPALPTAKELMTYKEADLNGGGLRLVTSPVTKFVMDVTALSMQAMQFGYADMDTARLQEQMYQSIEKSTGLSKSDLEKMEGMSDAEQEAYLRQRNVAASAQAAEMAQAAELAQLMEPVEPQVARWNEIGEKIDALYTQLEAAQKEAYARYASQLSSTTGKARNAVLAKYYADFAEVQRSTVQQAMRLRLEEQMPIAEEIEKYVAGVRTEHPDAAPALLNYPQMTSAAYFAEASHLLDLPEF